MALFFITALEGSEALISAAIASKFVPESVRAVDINKWFVRSNSLTAKDVSDLLVLGDPTAISGAGYLIVTVSGYYGVAQPDLWEWLRIQHQTVP
jgi:hypothetical protein